MQRQTVSFSDCSSSAGRLEGFSDLEKTESRMNVLSRARGRDSHDNGGEDIRREFSNGASAEAGRFRQYNGSTRAWGAQIYEKRQRVCPGTFNGEEETTKPVAAFKLVGHNDITELKPPLEVGQLENRLLSAHSQKDIVNTLISNSKNIDRFGNCLQTDQDEKEEEEKDPKGSESERIYSPGGGGEDHDKKGSPWSLEHMFEKTVTPSDVGKLNRLVIPKQHAEKYFPLSTYTIEKGLLLSFEDSTGKPWRFRYSYWNSSQSYVLTKGWSRFVKDKKLEAGDIVAFDRALATHDVQDPNLQRLIISYRRKPFGAARRPPGLPGSVNRPLQLTSHAQQFVSSRTLISPQWMPLLWPANNMSGESSRGAAETGALRPANTQPMDLLTDFRFITTEARKGIRESGFPFSTHRSSDTRECERPAMDSESSVRELAPHVIQLKSRGFSRDDLSFPIENKVPEAAATSFDHSTSKKVVRLFGVDLECGK